MRGFSSACHVDDANPPKTVYMHRVWKVGAVIVTVALLGGLYLILVGGDHPAPTAAVSERVDARMKQAVQQDVAESEALQRQNDPATAKLFADDRPETPGERTAKVDAAESAGRLLDGPGRPTPKAAVKAFAAARDGLGKAVYVCSRSGTRRDGTCKRFKPDPLDSPDSVEVGRERAIVTYIPAITPGMHTEFRFVVSRNSNEAWVVRGVKECTVGFRTQCREMSLR
jgi:hypothetical protein